MKTIAVIGAGATKESLERILAEKGIKDVIIMDPLEVAELSGTSYPSLKPPREFKIEERPELGIIPAPSYKEVKDGRTLRRERRKRMRKMK